MRSRFLGTWTGFYIIALIHDKRTVRAINALGASEINTVGERETCHKRCSLARVIKIISFHKAPRVTRQRGNFRARRTTLKCHRTIVYRKSSPEIIILHRARRPDTIRTCPRVKGFYKRPTRSKIDVCSRYAIRARVLIACYLALSRPHRVRVISPFSSC